MLIYFMSTNGPPTAPMTHGVHWPTLLLLPLSRKLHGLRASAATELHLVGLEACIPETVYVSSVRRLHEAWM
jgi:hypothetical protein